MPDAVLVSMPFGPVMRPSIGLSLLKAGLAGRGISSSVSYFSIRFAELLGWTAYSEIADGSAASLQDLAGEWIFNGALFEVALPDEKRYVDEILRRPSAGLRGVVERPALERILRARSRVDRFLDWCLKKVQAERPAVVGFSSSFQQHVASLALAKRIRQRMPEVAIIFGGANCEGTMGAETVRQFAFIDALVSGEGDIVVPELVDRLLRHRPLEGLRGVRTQKEIKQKPAAGALASAPLLSDLDLLPFPDYSDFFMQFRSSRLGRRWEPALLFESSRGCWWGQTVHCTFCGLNGDRMAFRSKSSRRALNELLYLARAHPRSAIQAVDSVMDSSYFDDLLPRLARKRVTSSIFYETRSNLRKEDVRRLRKAGITSVQPGIESLSDPVLRLMRKGVTALQNIQLLKWCKELGVQPHWNLLCAMPGEPTEEYERMTALVPLLSHLTPPAVMAPLRLDRFSPLYDRAQAFGLVDVRPLKSFGYVYPLTEEALANLAPNFSYGYKDGRSPLAYTRRLSRRVEWWQSLRGAALFSVDLGNFLLIFDLRPRARQFLTALSGVDRAIYVAADGITDVRTLSCICAEKPETIERRLERMTSRGLILRDGQRCLALAIPCGAYQPDAAARARFIRAVRAVGKRVPGGTRIDLPEPVAPPRGRHAMPDGRCRSIRPSLFVVPDERTLVVRDLPWSNSRRR